MRSVWPLFRWNAVVVGLMLVLASTSRAEEPAWKAGIASARITPQEPIFMAGYASRSRPSESVLADIYVKALALEDAEGHQAVLVTSDLIGFRSDVAAAICDAVAATSGLERHQILLNSSHTHTGPIVTLSRTPSYGKMTQAEADVVHAYTTRLVSTVADTVGKALGDLQPARLSHGVGFAPFVMNRREPTPNGVKLGNNFSGLADRSAPVLRVDSAEGEVRAVVFGCACHNTTLTGQHYVISGDYAGFAQEHIQATLPDVTALFVTGCAGSANPYPRGTEEFAQQHGRTLGEEVCRVLEGGLKTVSGPLRTTFDLVDLPLQDPPSREELDRWLSGRGWQPSTAQRMLELLENRQEVPATHPAPLAVWQFGDDLTLVGLSGEVVVDYVPLIQEQIGPLNLWIAAYCNDVFGYLPSAKVLREGGYETRGVIHNGVGLFSPDAETVLVNAVQRLATQAGRDVSAATPPAQ